MTTRTARDRSGGHVPRLLKGDAHDRRLLENVRPGEWPNPTPAGRYHLVVVGGGTGGLVTAAIASALGARVALVERGLLGGDCLNFGCVPSKAVLEAARGWKRAREAWGRFGGPAAEGEGDFGVAMARMREIRAGISAHDSAGRFRDLGVDVFLGHAEFDGPDTVRVSDRVLRFRRAVLAVGTRPAVPDIPGLREAGFRTSETVFDLTALPRRLAVLGGGPIGCELGQAFARFGARVTLVEAGERILGAEDEEAGEVVRRSLERDGVDVRVGSSVARVAGGAGEKVAGGAGEKVLDLRGPGAAASLAVDEVLVAVGRVPNLEGLALERAGIRADPAAGIEVDARMRTSNPLVYAIGDVASRHRFTHAADAQARMVVRNALFFGRGKVADLVIPRCTYTDPELAHVGIEPAEVAARGAEIDTVTVRFDEVDRAILEGATEGFLRVHLQRGSDRIAGATIVGDAAGELLPLLTHAMTAGVGLGTLGETIFTYPTRAEVIRKAADAWRRTKLTKAARRAFSVYFRSRSTRGT